MYVHFAKVNCGELIAFLFKEKSIYKEVSATRTHIFTKALIMLMIVFVSLPCPLKREMKRQLGIPVTGVTGLEKQSNNIACSGLGTDECRTVSISCKEKKLGKLLDRYDPAPYANKTSQPRDILVPELIVYPAVPIYILQGQYLI